MSTESLYPLINPAAAVLERLVLEPVLDPKHKHEELEPKFMLQKFHESYQNLCAAIRANNGSDEDVILAAVSQLFTDTAGVAVVFDRARQRVAVPQGVSRDEPPSRSRSREAATRDRPGGH